MNGNKQKKNMNNNKNYCKSNKIPTQIKKFHRVKQLIQKITLKINQLIATEIKNVLWER